jgi:hypothetical protein
VHPVEFVDILLDLAAMLGIRSVDDDDSHYA